MLFKISHLFFQIILSSISLIVILHLLLKDSRKNQVPPINPILNILINIFVILFIAFFPIENSSDKKAYTLMLNNIDEISTIKDYGWYYYNFFYKLFFDNEMLFFLITSILYFLGFYVFFKSFIQRKYLFYILLTTFASLGYLAYGVNTIRAGLALSFFLLAFSKKNKRITFLLLMIISVSIHKSISILIFGLFITYFIKNTKTYLFIWVLSLIISALDLNSVSSILNWTSNFDERVGKYLITDTNKLYQSAGFRIDFIIYSLLPLIFGYFYIFRLNFKNSTYIRLFNLYIIVNSFWLLIIRIPYADRFAYLSWFLLPFLMLYPLFLIKIIKNRKLKLSINMLLIIGINLILLITKHLL